MLLVLDLDQTLIHTTFTELSREPDFVEDGYMTYWRPGVCAFLDACLNEFEVGIWTASTRDYAEPILAALGVLDRFSFVWCRERCAVRYEPWSVAGSALLKPLKKLLRRGYDRRQVIYVDDSADVVRMSYGNLVQVVPFIGDDEDRELERLLPYLRFLRGCENVREINKRGWRNRLVENFTPLSTARPSE